MAPAVMRRLWRFFFPPPPPEPPKWVPILGEMQKTLQMAEYLPLRPLPMFESNFTQVTNNGTPALLHNKSNKLTMGVAASLPGLMLPDILLIARPPEDEECSSLILTRMIPLDLARLYVDDLPTWRLKLRLRSGRHYFLALDAPEHELAFLFDRWIRLINMLRGPKLSKTPKTEPSVLEIPPEVTLASTWHFQVQSQGKLTVEVADPTFPCKIFSSHKPKTKMKLTKPIKHSLRSQAVGDSVPLIWSQLQSSEDQMQVTKTKSYPHACSDRSEPLIHVSDKASITIRTIFSIISNTINQAHKSDSEEDTSQGRLMETPSKCLSQNSTGFPVTVSSNQLDTLLWAQNLEDLMNPEYATLSSLNTSHPPAFYIFPPNPSFLKSKDKARPTGSKKHVSPLSSHKAACVPIESRKMPFILDQSNKVPAKPAPAQMASALPTPSRKTPTALWSRGKASGALGHFFKSQPSVSQKTPTTPGQPLKPQVITTPTQKTLTPNQKLLQAPAHSQKAMHTKKDHLIVNIRSQKDPTAPYQKALNSRAKASGDPRTLQGGGVLERKTEGKQEPVLLVGGQNTTVVDVRAQTMPLHLPFATTKKQSKEILISETQEALKGREKLEDCAHKMKETTVNLPNLKSKETEMQKRVLTEEIAVENPYTEDNRPFSAEGLALAKMKIMANSKHQRLKPATISLPSSFSVASNVSSMLANLPFDTSQTTFSDGSQVVVIEQSGSCTKVNTENTRHQMERKPAEDLPVSSNPRI
ncbi:Golgi-associated RAB2 interactor protein 5B [Mus musculus]|uniref:Golgi associated RAB2 interactor family member 5B n=1 Tax=Mus musculus TaxID=10090 RepID=L7N480_MOUSE|nr:Golgi-associated RAB2 interactor protein 5B [Mus musculus]|eukprot:NP_766483.3 protein FAM71E2 [Mus musculus]